MKHNPTEYEKRLLKSASDVAAIMKTILEISDEVKLGQSPLDTQGRLLRLQSLIQKHSQKIKTVTNRLCDLIEESGGKLWGAV